MTSSRKDAGYSLIAFRFCHQIVINYKVSLTGVDELKVTFKNTLEYRTQILPTEVSSELPRTLVVIGHNTIYCARKEAV